MALVTHQMQGCYATFPRRPLSWSKGIKLKQHVSTLHIFARADKHFRITRNLRLSAGACIHGLKLKHLKISAFKGIAQNDESGNRAKGSKVSKNTVKFSYVPKESTESVKESTKVHSAPVSFTSEANEGIVGSPAIHKLFKKWLNLLRTEYQVMLLMKFWKDYLQAKNHNKLQVILHPRKEYNCKLLVLVHSTCSVLNEKIKEMIYGSMPRHLCIKQCIPFYLAVNSIYGVDVSKELTPLWILGPLTVAFYIKMLRVLWALYVFSFQQTAKIINNLPTYYLVASSYIAREVQAHILRPVVNVKNLDYKELSRKTMKEFEEWFLDKYLDFVESIWPYYCRTIRFLKRANLI